MSDLTRGVLALSAGALCGAALGLATRPEARAQASSFWADVRSGMLEREGQLRLALGLDDAPAGTRLDPRATHDLLDDPAGWRAPRG